jgi:hypothetical protein
MDLVLYALWVSWARCQRWDAATQFFTALSRTHPPAAVYVAAAAEEQGVSGARRQGGAGKGVRNVQPRVCWHHMPVHITQQFYQQQVWSVCEG